MDRRWLLSLALLALAGCGGSSAPAASTAPAAPKARAAPANKIVPVALHNFPPNAVAAFGEVWVVGHRDGIISGIDPRSARVTRTITIGGTFYSTLAAGDGALWTYRDDTRRLIKVDPTHARVVASVHVPVPLHDIEIVRGNVWATAGDDQIVRIAQQTLRFTTRMKLPIKPGPDGYAVASARGTVWIGGDGEIVALDTATARFTKRLRVSGLVRALVAAPGVIYYVRPDEPYVFRVNVTTGRVARESNATSQPGTLALIDGRLLVTDDARNSVTVVDPASGRRSPPLDLRRGPAPNNDQPDGIGLTGEVLAGGAVWFPDWDAEQIYRVPLAKLFR